MKDKRFRKKLKTKESLLKYTSYSNTHNYKDTLISWKPNQIYEQGPYSFLKNIYYTHLHT